MASTAGSTAVDTTVSGPQSGGITQRLQDFGNFLYNSEEGKVLGRTAKSWGKLNHENATIINLTFSPVNVFPRLD